jgi:UTP-glucose-1-phosphate uridylyltransferase
MIRKAVIPAAGHGTRFLPATKSSPKEMLPIVDTPVIQYVVEEAAAAGITDILMVIGKGKRAIEEHFDRNFQLENQLSEKGRTEELRALKRISELADIHFVWQKEMKGLGDAIYCARHHVNNEPFAVLLGPSRSCLKYMNVTADQQYCWRKWIVSGSADTASLTEKKSRKDFIKSVILWKSPLWRRPRRTW